MVARSLKMMGFIIGMVKIKNIRMENQEFGIGVLELIALKI
jgi:hypothetical protein